LQRAGGAQIDRPRARFLGQQQVNPMKHAFLLAGLAMLTLPSATALAKTPKPLVTIDLERRALPWPSPAELQLPADVSEAVAALAAEQLHEAEVERAATGSARQEMTESPTVALEKAQAALGIKRRNALTLLRPVARTAVQYLLLAELEADEAQDAFEQAVAAEAKAPKFPGAPVEAACAKAMAAAPQAETARSVAYLWAIALEARGQNAEASKHYREVAQGAAEPLRSEVLYRAGALELAKEPARALAVWSDVTAMPYLVYASYRQTTEFARTGQCADAGAALSRLKSAPPIDGTSYVAVASQAAATCKPHK
jgi:hypothetical protein